MKGFLVSEKTFSEISDEIARLPEYDAAAATITLSGNTAKATSSAVTLSEGLITVKSAGAYVVEGSATD